MSSLISRSAQREGWPRDKVLSRCRPSPRCWAGLRASNSWSPLALPTVSMHSASSGWAPATVSLTLASSRAATAAGAPPPRPHLGHWLCRKPHRYRYMASQTLLGLTLRGLLVSVGSHTSSSPHSSWFSSHSSSPSRRAFPFMVNPSSRVPRRHSPRGCQRQLCENDPTNLPSLVDYTAEKH